MNRGSIVFAGILWGCSSASPAAAPVVATPAAPEPPPKTAAEEPSPPPIQAAPAVVGRHPGAALRAWVAGQEVGGERHTQVPAPVGAELVALAQPGYADARKSYFYDQPARPLELRWARVLARDGAAAVVAFAVGHSLKADYGSDPAALIGWGTARVGAAEATAPAVIFDVDDPSRDVNDFSYEDDRDVDGDGRADQLIFTYAGRSGGGHDFSGTMILLGSKNGSAVEVQTEHRDAEYEGGEPYSSDTTAAVHCWTRVGASHPVLLAVMTSADSYQGDGGEAAGVYHSALAADAAGTIHTPAVHAVIAGKAASEDALVDAWRALAGVATEPAFVGTKHRHIPVGCPGTQPAVIIPGNGTMACPDHSCDFTGDYLLLTDFAFTAADAVRLYQTRTGASDTPPTFTFERGPPR